MKILFGTGNFRASWSVPIATLLFVLITSANAGLTGTHSTYTTTADFQTGTLINLSSDSDQLQLLNVGEPFAFIWVAASGRDTILKIDTETGNVLGEYKSRPDGMAGNPSRTTVDANGNVWAGNRNEASGGQGSIVHIGLLENGQCVDRNLNGIIDTSTGLGDVRSWTGDSLGGVSGAQDECIIHYVRTSGTNVRSVAVDGSNNVWIGGLGNRVHELYDQNGIAVVGTQFNLGCGGYGALVDANGVLWSAGDGQNVLLRYDPATKTGSCLSLGRFSYGLGIDPSGFIWHSNWSSNTVLKISPAGVIAGSFFTGGASNDRGVAVTPDGHVWIANSGGSDVSRLDNSGALLAVIPVGITPTGVAVDAAGKVWVTNYSSHSAMRIDPAINGVDLEVSLGAGAYPYNYSDMTGSTLTAPPDNGTWSVVHDSGINDAPWTRISWNADEPGDSSILVSVASSNDGVVFGAPVVVANGDAPGVANGRYLRISAAFSRSTYTDGDGDGVYDSPVLFDLTIVSDDQGPITTNVVADPNPVPAFAPLVITANVDDSTTGGSDIASANLQVDSLTGPMAAMDGTFDAVTEDVTVTLGGGLPVGVYEVCVSGTDVAGNTGPAECRFLAVYDPDAGFVTGGGWINSPAGAYAPDPLLTGSANFGFVAKYKKGQDTPDGNTEFQFQAGDLNFKSSAYDWLVVAGPKAMYKGSGNINGLAGYGFMLSAVDANLTPSTDLDLFRIKIWDEFGNVVYDNEAGEAPDADPSTALAGGSIVIHSSKK
jgi:streptogramin lyase